MTDDVHLDISPAHYVPQSKQWLPREEISTTTPVPSSVCIISWNIDCMRPEPTLRLHAALSYLQYNVFKCRTNRQSPDPSCILLQGVLASAFTTILDNKWVQNSFTILPSTTDAWPKLSKYGTVTLVSRSLHITRSFSVHFSSSEAQRHALFVDVRLSSLMDMKPMHSLPQSIVTLRIANTQLEPLPDGAPTRERQLKLIAGALLQDGLFAGVTGGDFNSTTPGDSAAVGSVGLWDAWSGEDEDEGGFTWGYQPRSPISPGRLDKLVYTPRPGFFIDTPKRIAIGRKYGKPTRRRWISDHYALLSRARCVYFPSDVSDHGSSDHEYIGSREQSNFETCSLDHPIAAPSQHNKHVVPIHSSSKLQPGRKRWKRLLSVKLSR